MARTEYSEKLAARICARLAQGEGLVAICRDKSMPNVTTVYSWIATNDKFKAMYQLARDDQADTLADEIVAIADEAPMSVSKDADGNAVRTPADVTVSGS